MKGHKTGGRTKGTKNIDRSKIFEDLQNKYPDFNPLISLADIAKKTKNESIKVLCYSTIARYILPQLKAVEVDLNTDDNTIHVIPPSFTVITLDEKAKQNVLNIK